ncbi:MAG: NAD(P)H-hydrate dehydratase [Candidatus Micrarchaeia archaeon]|jgi:NAD(P)H-hydrate epimerase
MQNLKEFANSDAIVSADEMHAIELNAYSMGISALQLMENAGCAVASFVRENFKSKNILLFCGPGNNGGDGFVVARMLSKDYNVKVVIVGEKVKGGPSLSNFTAISSSPFVDINYYAELDKEELEGLANWSDVIIDAIFGTGFKGELKGIFKDAVRLINSSGKKVVAIDVPSGFGEDCKLCVKADYTITFHKIKEGMEKLRNVVVKEIGIPLDAELIAGPGDVYLASKSISPFATKHDRGMLLIIGGSKVYHGAPISSLLSASAIGALRAGAGYALLYVPRSILNSVRSLSQNQIVKPLGDDYISFTNEIKKEIDKAQAVVIGMGITKEKPAQQACTKIVEYALSKGKKVVVDADGISAVARIKNKNSKNLLITPHDGEFYRFSGIKLEHESNENLPERISLAIKIAKEKGINVLLKGHNTIITDGTHVKVNMAKSANLSTMGTGDVLAGIIGGFAALGAGLFEAAAAGSYIHSKASELLKIEKGNHIIAFDLIEVLPKILMEFDKVLQ